MLAARYADEPTVIGVDLHNEPHGEACWGCGDQQRDWAAAATRAGNAVLAENPRLLVIIEGVERQADGAGYLVGRGTRRRPYAPIRLSVPDRVVYSPHDYPASLYPQSWFADPAYPANLPAQWDPHLGLPGHREHRAGAAGGVRDPAADRLRPAVAGVRSWSTSTEHQISFAYWSFNPNSGDTGGLVADDWVTPQRDKLERSDAAGSGSAGSDALRLGDPTPTPVAEDDCDPDGQSHPDRASPTPTAEPDARPQRRRPHGAVAARLRVGRRLRRRGDPASDSGRSGWSLSYADPAARSVVNAWGMTLPGRRRPGQLQRVPTGRSRCRPAASGGGAAGRDSPRSRRPTPASTYAERSAVEAVAPSSSPGRPDRTATAGTPGSGRRSSAACAAAMKSSRLRAPPPPTSTQRSPRPSCGPAPRTPGRPSRSCIACSAIGPRT